MTTLALSGNAMASSGVQCAPTGMESVSTPRDHYQAGEVATISGGGYAVACDVQVDVERPDGVVESFPATTDLGGNFTLDYQIPPPPGVLGTYGVVVRGLGGAELASTTFEDAPSPNFDIAPNHLPTTGSHVITALIRNTNTSSSSSESARCIRVETGSNVSVTSATFTVANPGTSATQTGNWSLTPGANFVQLRADSNTRRGLVARSGAGHNPNDNWVRFEITVNATAAGTATWTARMNSNATADCPDGASNNVSDTLGVSVAQALPRQYTADFRDPATVPPASALVVPPPTVVEGASQAYRIRVTRTAGSDDLSYAAVALPTCFTNVTGITTANSTTGGNTPDFAAQLTDNFLRFVTTGDKLSGTGQWTQVTFTAKADCPTGIQVFRSAAWKNTSPETPEGDIFRLSPGTLHPTLTVLSANVAPTVAATNATVTVDEGQMAANSGVWADANATDMVSLSASIGTVTKSGTNAAGTWSWSYPTTDGPVQTQVVTITANDGTTSTSTTFQLNVNNVAPSATFNAPGSVDEGSNIDISLTTPSDPSSVDTAAGFEYAFDCGDGSGYGAFGSSSTASCSTNDNGPRTVGGRIRDKDGGVSEYSASVSVENVAPSATFNAPESVDEGSSIGISLADPSDPSSADTTAGFEYRFSCDNGDTWTDWGSSNEHSCPTDDNGTRNVKGEIRDKDGGTSIYSDSVTVNNVAPSATFNAPESVNEGSSIEISLSDVVDPGADTHEYRFKCGDSDWTAYGTSASHSCATTDNGSFVVQGQVRDDDSGESAEYSASVTVNNVAPSATFNAPESVDEGSNIEISLSGVVDPGSADTHEYRFKCGDGDWTAYGASASHSCATTDNGTVVVQGQVRDDDDGTSEAYSASVTVNNVAPSATFNAPESVNEGSDINLSLSGVVDPGSADTHEYRFSCDGGDTWTDWGPSASHSCSTSDNGTVQVRGQVRDDDGGTSEVYSDSVTVDNVAPSATFNNNGPVDEGSNIDLSLTDIVDPGTADTHEFRFSCDGGTNWTDWGPSPSHSCSTNDNGTRNVKGQVRDDDGGESPEYSASVTVNNVAPSATFNAPESVNEGSNIELSLSDVVDPGSADTHEYRFKCGDGDWSDWGSSASAACATSDNGSVTVSGQVHDDDGGTSEVYSAEVVVDNVAPSATFNAPETVTEGSAISISLTEPSDPSSADTTAGFEYRFSCDNGETWTDWGANNEHSCPTDDNGTRNVKGEIRDKDGGTSTYSASVGVTNVAPSATFNAPGSVNEGSDINLSLTDVVDPGSADTHEYRFKCGAGDWTDYGASASHACPTSDNGTVEVKGQVRDDDGDASPIYEATVTVDNVAPSATFNAPESVNEGSQIDVSLSGVVDPGSADTHEYRFSCNGGTTWTEWSSSANHACATNDNGTRSVKGQVRDDDGGESPEYSASVAVGNVAPTATFNAPTAVNEGSSISLSLTDAEDPSSVDTAAGFQYRFSCDGGDTWTEWGPSNAHSCPTDDNGTKAVRGAIRDKDLGENEYSAAVTVNNVAPTVTITSPPSGALYPAGAPIPVTATFTDPGTADTHSCTINGSAGVVTESNGSGTCTGSVVASPGGNSITVVVTDDDGASGTASTTVSALYAIYAHEKCSGGAGKGILVNGANASVGGFIHSNGNFLINGSNFQSGRATIHRSSTNNCKAVYDPSKVNFGPPSPTAPIQEPAARNWPRHFLRSEFTCTYTKDEFVFNTRGQTIPGGVYCANKTFKINADNIAGNITVLAPEIVINGKNISLTPHTKGVLLFNINLNGTVSPKDIVLDSDFSGDIHYLSGVLFNPGAGIKVNGTAVTIRNGFLQALWVEINLTGFRMVY